VEEEELSEGESERASLFKDPWQCSLMSDLVNFNTYKSLSASSSSEDLDLEVLDDFFKRRTRLLLSELELLDLDLEPEDK